MNGSIWPYYPDENCNVFLRPVYSSDSEEYTRIVTASCDFLHPWVEPPDDQVKFNSLLDKCGQSEFIALLVCQTSDRRILGNINLSQIEFGNFCSAYLGFWISEEFSGRGLMTAALDGLVHIAFGHMGLHRLEANIQPSNTKSKKLVERIGFRLEGYSPHYLRINGTWQDHERWAICTEDRSDQSRTRQ